MYVVIIGAGYVGLTTGACFASLGYRVCLVDIDKQRVENLRSGRVPIYEPGLDELLAENRKAGRLSFTSDAASAVTDADFVFLAVGTPSRSDGDIDLSFIEAAARSIAQHLCDQTIIVIKSTVVAGTARRVAEILRHEGGGRSVPVASNPEFLREGSAISDFLCADRIVVGADEPMTGNAVRILYRPLIEKGIPFITTSTTDAELIKYAANAFLALKIGFINDVANICENTGGNIMAVAHGIGLDARIGSAFLHPGPGFGGSCFPKDTRAYAATGRRFGAPQPLIETLIDRNEQRKFELATRILSVLDRQRPQKVAVLGFAFKAETDDVREAAALTIIPRLQEAGVTVCGHDPQARANAEDMLRCDVAWRDDPYDAVEGADAVVLLTEWDDYRRLDLGRCACLMSGIHLFDFRNLFQPEQVVARGLVYHGIGRPVEPPIGKVSSCRRGGGLPARTDVAASPR